ncbi:unnamed protein product [Heligmosomoides polygyrus]|uniref:DUF148 domain-containing protein n=1 Tax=Heligmosomoides polygyrus TaxID=6339 RepID=A0A183GI10_HELPZ|nr:unnamed protein product [Heligmosomoides polygyrus]
MKLPLLVVLGAFVLNVNGWLRGKPLSKLDLPNAQLEQHYHHRLPPFLKNVTEDARWEFFGIVRDLSTSMNEKAKEIQAWAKRQGPSVEEGVAKYFKKMDKFWNKVHDNTKRTLNELPTVYPKVHEIMSNMDLTPREIYNKIRELKLDSVTSHSLHAVVMAVIHSDADRDSYFMNADTFLERVAGPKIRKHFSLPGSN